MVEFSWLARLLGNWKETIVEESTERLGKVDNRGVRLLPPGADHLLSFSSLQSQSLFAIILKRETDD